MTEQQACTLCGAEGHTAAQCHWNSPGALESIRLPKHGTTIALEEMLAGYLPDDREYIRDVIEAYADIQARKAVMLYSGAGRQSDACDWLENLEGDAWADACEEIAASVQKHTEQAEGAQGERVVQTAPERIYLIVGADCPRDADFSELAEVTWCEDDLDDGIEYVRADKARADLAQPSPAPELERPDFGAWWATYPLEDLVDYNSQSDRMHAELVWKACYAQHDRIIGALRAEIDEVDGLSKRLDDLLHQTAIALRGPEPALTRYGYADLPLRVKTLLEERDVDLAKLAAMEQQEPVAWVTETDPEVTMGRGINWFPKNVAKLPVGTKLYAAPVAQAGQVPEGYMLITQDQVERHATTAWECPPQSRVVLVSTLKRLHEKNGAAPQPAKAGGQ
jgi:hypothetical protein